MYLVGDQVVYGIHGVCRVSALEEQTVDRKKCTFLVLEPIGQGESRFLIPTHNQVAMSKLRKVMTRQELDAMLGDKRMHEGSWTEPENQRKQIYRELLGSCDRLALLQMICTVNRHKQAQFAAGKKLHQCDDNFLRDGIRLAAGEIAVIMDLDHSQAMAYLKSRLDI